tara:strand:- start:4824 stop:6044 length:1221 start_codon:yes stop_codon:yes gene_type:complete
MKSSLTFLSLLVLFSCDKKPNIVLDNLEAKAVIEEVVNTSPEFLYGINLDSFSHSTHKIKWGQSFSDILSKNGVSNKDIYDASLLSRGVFNLKKIKKGNSYTLFFNNNSKKLIHFVYETSKYDFFICTLKPEISFKKVDKNISYVERQISGTIESSLYVSFSKNNFPIDLVNLMVDVFAWQIDFFRITPGDNYNIVYTEEIIDGEVVGVNGIKAARFTHNKKPFFAFSYDQGLGNDFFDENGKSLRKTFLRSPLKFYRISSRYKKKRFHPVLKRYKDHLGTDYAAPTGTQIFSVADGKVTEARYTRNNGYYVKIRHNNIFSTQYLHMSKFAKGIKPGRVIKQGQVIGYVGSTGLATGPHVCFRFWRNGRQVDPYKQNDLPEGDPVIASHLEAFGYVKDKYFWKIEG